MPVDPLALAIPLPRRLLEVSHVAHRLSTSQEFVRRLIREHRLPAVRLGQRWRIEEADLDAYIAACKVAHRKPGDDRREARTDDKPAMIFHHPRGTADAG